MAVEIEALKYAQTKFADRGIIADLSDMACVEEYINEYYRKVNKHKEHGIKVIYNDDVKKRQYIRMKLPDIPPTVINGVLDAEDAYYMQGMVKQDE